MKTYLSITFALLVLLSVSACELLPIGEEEEGLIFPEEVRMWAATATASEAFGGKGENRDDQSAFSATGSPDVESCDDSPYAWVINNEDDGEHWLELGYDQEIYVSKVRIRETFGPGAVIRIELYDGSAYQTFWEGKDTNKICPGFFEASYEITENNITKTMTPYSSDKVRITLDTDVSGWNEIDAVELVGYKERWYMYNETIMIG